MSPLVIPVQAVPNQTVVTQLNGQSVRINLYAKDIQVPVTRGIITDPPIFERIVPIFCDVYVSGKLVVGTVLCLNDNFIVRDSYLGLIGDLAIIDTQRNEPPQYQGLGSRWILTWWPPHRDD